MAVNLSSFFNFPIIAKKTAPSSLIVVYQLADIQGKEVCLHWNLMPCKNKSEKRCQRQLIPDNTMKEIGAVSVAKCKQAFPHRAL